MRFCAVQNQNGRSNPCVVYEETDVLYCAIASYSNRKHYVYLTLEWEGNFDWKMPTPGLATLASSIAVCRIHFLRENLETADVRFIFEENEPPKQISAHKAILASESPVFEAMFYGPIKEKGDVKIVDATFTTSEVVLQLIHNQLGVLNLDNISDIMCIADKYDCNGVMDICSQFLQQNVNDRFVCMIFGLAACYKLNGLIQFCMTTKEINWDTVLHSEAFLHADRSLLEHFLSLKTYNGKEKQVFENCIKWARRSCKTKAIADTPENWHSELGLCLLLIKFKDMKLNEFLNCAEQFPVFKFDEYKKIIKRIAVEMDAEQRKAKRQKELMPIQMRHSTYNLEEIEQEEEIW